MGRGTYFGHVTEHTALELSARACLLGALRPHRWAGADGRYDVIMECPQDQPEDSPGPGGPAVGSPSALVGIDLLSVNDIPRLTHSDLDAISRMVAESASAG